MTITDMTCRCIDAGLHNSPLCYTQRVFRKIADVSANLKLNSAYSRWFINGSSGAVFDAKSGDKAFRDTAPLRVCCFPLIKYC
jgi:hypothetical protein